MKKEIVTICIACCTLYVVHPSFSFAQFTPLWTQTSNPSTSNIARAITTDASGIYIAGYAYAQWCIEKRDLSTGNSIWSQASSNGGSARAVIADASGIYVAGYDYNGTGSNTQWRMEKRDLSTGNVIWTQLSDPSNTTFGNDQATAITADASGIYVAGYDGVFGNDQWRIEKRDLNTGVLITGFGTSGVVTNNPSTVSDDYPYAITSNASGIYVAGYDESPGAGNRQWRIEKRNLSTGALITSFGTAGVVTSDPGNTSWDQAAAIAADASGIYVAGYDGSLGNEQWRIEKRDLNTGALITGFGTSGVITSNPSGSIDKAEAITVDAGGIYVAGYDRSLGGSNYEWHIEKRDPGTGALICAQASNPSAGGDYAYAITADASGIYVAGVDNILGNNQWRIEKYDGVCVATPVEQLSFTADNFLIYPTVGSGIFTFVIAGGSKQSHIEIYNILGEKIYSNTQQFNNLPDGTQSSIIDISFQPGGVYFVHISTLADPRQMDESVLWRTSSGGKKESRSFAEKLIIQ